MRVFVSSTYYDLIDVRAELSDQLTDLGIVPVLSDDKLSEFRVQPDTNSIETCLVNLETCDEVIVILSKRYGGNLTGYDGISATHLEYRRAMKLKLPIHFYVRDRLEADYSIWKRNQRSEDLKYSWVDEHNLRLFDFLDERKKLAETDVPNWFDTFNSTRDLKAANAKYFEKRTLPKRLVEVINSGQFPLFDIDVDADIDASLPHVRFVVKTTNASSVPAFQVTMSWEGENAVEYKIVGPGRAIESNILLKKGPPSVPTSSHRTLVVQYESAIGITVTDEFFVTTTVKDQSAQCNSGLISRKFKRAAKELSFDIDE